MPRLARAVFEGVPHHITQRGNRRLGQPVLERWFDEQKWFLQGFILGVPVGAIIGVLWYQLRTKKIKSNTS